MKTTMGMDKAKVWISEKLGAKIATRVFRGLALGVLLAAGTGLYFSINQGEAGSSLVSEQPQCYPEIDVASCSRVSLMASFAPASVPGPSIRLSKEQLELIEDYDMVGIHWRIDERGNVVEVPIDGVVFDTPGKPTVNSPLVSEQNEYYEEVDLSSFQLAAYEARMHQKLDKGKVGNSLSSEQLELIQELEMMGVPWRIDDEENVVPLP